MFQFLPSQTTTDTAIFEQAEWLERPTSHTIGDEDQSSRWNRDSLEHPLNVGPISIDDIFQQARARLISMDIIPASVLEYTGQWMVEARMPQADDLIFQRTHMLQFNGRPLFDLVSAVRIANVIDEDACFALHFVTTIGHPVRGHSQFAVKKNDDHVAFAINAVSKPATWFSRLASPMARRKQFQVKHSIFNYLQTTIRLDLAGEHT